MKYVLLICVDETVEPSEEDGKALDLAVQAWDKKMIQDGILLQAQRLALSTDATTVHVQQDGETLLGDGPFAETKEQIAGFVVIECANLDEAIEVAASSPIAKIGKIEVRPFWPE